ncbi:hypothetical protein BDN72DRAFT_841926 [Pluteus cervinus]|uniref:Uncharacterized protein n=1 Tax=Pluteus cervinus TaxID=181527 RepID=A0ACD3AS35_9AGAR|nr:hypothetical protein BDN72DRAFT_841926 [Pluteus cervinus]
MACHAFNVFCRMLLPATATDDQPSSQELPPEILAEIVKELPWNDVILHVRKTNRRLNGVSKSLPVWQTLITRGTKPRPDVASIIHLERPIESYTPAELERIFVRWKSADIGVGVRPARAAATPHIGPVSNYEQLPWLDERGGFVMGFRPFEFRDTTTPSHIPPPIIPPSEPRRHRRIYPNTVAQCLHLVEGGRWLLVGTYEGVLYYDLDAEWPGVAERSLIDQRTPSMIQRVPAVSMGVDIDRSSPILKFNLALIFSKAAMEFEVPGRVEVWEVRLQDVTVPANLEEGNSYRLGPGTSLDQLVATQLTSFSQEPIGRSSGISICGEVLAYTVVERPLGFVMFTGSVDVVINWRTARGSDYPKGVFRSSGSSALISNNLLQQIHPAVLSFVPLFEVPKDRPSLVPLPGVKWERPTFSNSILCGNTLRLAAITGSSVYGFIITQVDQPNGLPRFEFNSVLLVEGEWLAGSKSYKISLSYNHLVIRSEKPSVVYFVRFSWPDDGGVEQREHGQRADTGGFRESFVVALELPEGRNLSFDGWNLGHGQWRMYFEGLDMGSGRIVINQGDYILIYDLGLWRD